MEGGGAEGPRGGTGGRSRGGLKNDIPTSAIELQSNLCTCTCVGQVFHDGTMHGMQQLGGTGSCDCFLHTCSCGDEVPETLVLHNINPVGTLKKAGQFGHVVVRRSVPEPHIIFEQLRYARCDSLATTSRTRSILCCERARRSCSHMACAHIQLPPSSTLFLWSSASSLLAIFLRVSYSCTRSAPERVLLSRRLWVR